MFIFYFKNKEAKRLVNSTEYENFGSNNPSDTITNKPNQDSVIDDQTKASITESN